MHTLSKRIIPFILPFALHSALVDAQTINVHSGDGGSGGREKTQPALQEPAVLSSEDGRLTLDMKLTTGVIETNCHKITTRLYQPAGLPPVSPGPTLRLKKGDVLELNLENTLARDASEGISNQFRAPNTTNFHTHGLHVSPKPGSDDVLFTTINGGESLNARFDIPAYHTAGTYWYHPHFHGSTATQVGGGALGAIIIEDSQDDHLPDDIAALPEHVLVLSQIKADQMNVMANESGDSVWNMQVKPDQCTQHEIDADADSFLVNGQVHPYLELEAGQWTRLRLVNGALMNWVDIQKPDNCEFQLLAKDGIYLDDAPREVNHSVLPGGGRADIAVKCDSTGDIELSSVLTQERFSNEFLWQGNLLTLRVKESSRSVAESLSELRYQRPCYLPDLLDTNPESVQDFVLTDNPELRLFQVNEKSFDVNTPSYNMSLGSVQNFHLTNIDFHTFHIHISPFQLLQNGGPEGDNYFLKGDWHDTIFLPDLPIDAKDTIPVGYQSDVFDGDYVVHCHILPHEDQGMMGYVHVIDDGIHGQLCAPTARPIQPQGGDEDTSTLWKIIGGTTGGGLALGVATTVATAGVCVAKHIIKRRSRAHGYSTVPLGSMVDGDD